MHATLKRANPGTPTRSPSQLLRTAFAAVRISFTWLGVRKSLSPDQKAQAAENFGAEGTFLSAGKKLVDTRHPAFQALTSLRNRIQSYWRGMSLPYPEIGIRLIKQADVDRFDQQMREFKAELEAAVAHLDRHFDALKSAARERLGSLYNEADYPASLANLFAVSWDFPSVEPPDYLMRLNPELYEEERRRMASRFDEAVKLAEEAFTAEFAKLVSHLTERLTASVDGEKKIFRDSAIQNLRDFFDRFRSLNVHSSADLDRLVETAQQVVAGVEPQAVRESSGLRQQITSQLAAVQASLDQMLVDQPRRKILRPAKITEPG